MIAVDDEAGLNHFDSCTFLSYSWVQAGLAELEALGATQIRSYCYRASWAMVAVKGEGAARAEALAPASQVSARAEVALQ